MGFGAYSVAQACILHFDQDLVGLHLVQDYILEDKWGSRRIDHKSLCRDLLFRYHDGIFESN